MANQKLKEEINNANIKYWQIADELGITDSTFSKKLRKELPSETKEKIYAIIKKLKESEKND